MTFGKFFGLGFVLSIILGAAKIFYIQVFNPESVGVVYAFWVLILLATIACVRRLGVINYLEAFLVAGFWMIFILIVDFLITSQIVGFPMFARIDTWVGFLVMILSVVLFHKKRHIQIRKEHASHGGHH